MRTPLETIWRQHIGVSEASWDIIKAAWSQSTISSYGTVAKKWLQYTSDNGVSVIYPTVPQVVDFLVDINKKGGGHSTVATSRSFLSCFIHAEGRPIGEHPMLSKLVKRVKVINQPEEKNSYIWDPTTVIDTMAAWGPISDLTLEQLTKRTLMLFLLATGQRIQGAFQLLRKDMVIMDNSIRIKYSTKMKSNDPAKNPLTLRFDKLEEERVCVFTHLTSYLNREDTAGAHPRTFGTVKTPVTPASSVTLSRLIRQTLTDTGIEEHFRPYSVRSASTSAADRLNVPMDKILTSAGWARTSTFARFYKRPLLQEQEDTSTETNFITYFVRETP